MNFTFLESRGWLKEEVNKYSASIVGLLSINPIGKRILSLLINCKSPFKTHSQKLSRDKKLDDFNSSVMDRAI